MVVGALELIVMKAALEDITFLIDTLLTFNFIYKPVFSGDSPGPIAF